MQEPAKRSLLVRRQERKGSDINQFKMAPQEMNKDFDLPGAEKKIGRQGLEKKNKSLKVKDIPKNGNEVQVVEGCWQKPPLDIMENIISRLDVLDRIRLSILCKYWNSIAMRRDIRSTAPPFPWLVLAQRSSDYLEFSIPSEGKVIKIDLPKRIRGRFHSSSKGWLIMVEGKSIFLLNPISGDKQELPSLRNIPSLHNLEEEDEFDSYHVGGGKPPQFLREIALSSSNTSECTVAAIFSSKEIGVCRPGEKSWSIFSMLDDRKGSPLRLLFSSCGMLYVLVKNNEIENEGVITRMLRFGDGDELQLKLVYDKKEESRKNSSHGWGPNAYLDVIIEDKSYLVESTASNEVLLIHQFKNQEVTDCGRTTRTLDFLVYKIDPENDEIFIKLQSLENQILFVSSRGGSLSIPAASNSKGLKVNCIHFVELGVKQCLFGLDYRFGTGTSRVFYLDGQKSEESANSKEWGLSWWTPTSFW